MLRKGKHTYSEIKSQPQVWQTTLEDFRQRVPTLDSFLKESACDRVLFTGCGSTHYLSKTAAFLFQKQTGVDARSYPASEFLLYPQTICSPPGRTMLVAVSRSAETTETIRAVQIFKETTGGPVLVVTNYPQRTLAEQADFLLAAPAGQEESVAQTRSFSSMLLLVQLLAARAAGLEIPSSIDTLPETCQSIFDRHEETLRTLAGNHSLERFFFLGHGPAYGIASEAMLKMKEMSLSNSEAYHPLEFRHGPMSMVDERACVVGLLTESGYSMEESVLEDMSRLGGNILSIFPGSSQRPTRKNSNHICLESDAPEWMLPVLYLPALQLLAFYRALARDKNPDRPTNLESVVRLNTT